MKKRKSKPLMKKKHVIKKPSLKKTTPVSIEPPSLDLEKLMKYKEPSEGKLAKMREALLGVSIKEYPRRVDSTRWVAKAHGGYMRLVVARDQDDVFFVSFDEDELIIQRQELVMFQREYAPYPYAVKTAAEKWLHSPRFMSVTSTARAELEAIIKGQPSPLQLEINMAKKKGKKAATAAVVGKQKEGGKGKGRKPGSGVRIRELLMEGKLDPEAIVAVIHREFPGSKATTKDVSWNKSFLAKEGKKVPEPKSKTKAKPKK
jgi:hypothetical protein